MCNYCGRKGHLEIVCNQKKKESNLKVGNSRGIGKRVQGVDPEESGEEDDEDYIVLKVESESENSKPYYME